MHKSDTIRADTGERHRAKYDNPNPIHRLTLGRFFDRVADHLKVLAPASVLEFGCGEGFLLRELKQRGFTCPELVGVDLREDALLQARELHPEWRFDCADIFAWSSPRPAYDLVLASQVLEHIPNPLPVLRRLLELTSKDLVLTVPCEPWFQGLNFLRGRDLLRLGNHPEHVNRWSRRAFVQFVEQAAEVVEAEVVFPFTYVRARTR